MVMPQSPIQRPTIYDVARRAGVSKSLVSLVLQGSGRVSAGRRAAVLTAIDDLGYRPSRAATLLASHRTKSVEVVIDDYRNLSFVGLVTGIQSALSADGYHLTVTDRRLNAHLAEQGAGSLLGQVGVEPPVGHREVIAVGGQRGLDAGHQTDEGQVAVVVDDDLDALRAMAGQ